MLNVLLPDNNHKERTYGIKVLLDEFLGLETNISFHQTPFAAEITFENGHRLLIEDHFFNAFPAPLSYLSQQNIPNQIQYISQKENPLIPEQDIPVIFWHPRLEVRENEIICGIDIFASAFFMLTRWEEYVKPDRDQHGRFPAAAALAFQQGFLQRPVVNEYVEMLWKMLAYLGIGQERKQRKFEVMVTHDVDYPLLWNSLFSPVRKIGGSLLKRKNIPEAASYLKNYFLNQQGKAKDPFDTFDYLMTHAEARQIKAHFFFLCGGKHPLDNAHSFPQPFIQTIINDIQTRGHNIGFHPSYETYNNATRFQQELQKLKAAANRPIQTGRQHFLRFEAPTTWQIWEEHNMEWDSTLYYAEAGGFRCGTCWPFPVFNFLTRQPLKLREIPLTLMEGTFLNYLKLSPEEMMDKTIKIFNTVKAYNGTFVLLWHNSIIDLPEWKPYTKVYEQFFELID